MCGAEPREVCSEGLGVSEGLRTLQPLLRTGRGVRSRETISKQQQLEMTPSSGFTRALQGTCQPGPCCLRRRQQTFCHQSLGGNRASEACGWFPNRSPKCQTAGTAAFTGH